MLQGHGDDGYKHDRPILADFSTNVWQAGAPLGLKDHLFAQWDKVQRYPEVIAESLALKISQHHGLSADHLLVANGSTESIYLIAQAFSAKRSAITIPSFSEYEDACRLFGHTLSFVNWDEVGQGKLPATDLLFICNPNNPTGQSLPQLEEIIAKNKSILFVVDEAFIEFTFSVSSVLNFVSKYDNLIVLRSMTKAYAIPGLRLGYMVAQPNLIKQLKSCKLPWTVNVMAIEAGHFIFDHLKDLQLPLQQMLLDKAAFIQSLAALDIIAEESHTHFFIAKTPIFNAAALKTFLLGHYDLLIRDASNFRGLTDQHFRLATLSPVNNALLINALSEWKHTSL